MSDNNVIDFEQGRKRLREKAAFETEDEGRLVDSGDEDDTTMLIYDPKPGTVAVRVRETLDHVAHFTVAAPADLVTEAVEHARASIARRQDVDPDDVLALSRLRASIGAETFDLYVASYVQQALLAKAVMRTGVMPFTQPDLIDETIPHAGEDYTFIAQVLVHPEVELSSYEPVSVIFPEKSEITDADVDAYLAHVSEELGSMSREGLGDIPAGVDPAVIDEAWVATFMPEAGNLAGLRSRVRDILEREAVQAYEDELESRCADELAKRLPDDAIGDAYVEYACGEIHANRVEDLAARGVDFYEVSKSPQFDESAWDRSIEQEARATVARAFALDALADHLDIQIDREDVLEVLESFGNGHEPIEALQDVIDSGQMPHICEIALRRRAGHWLAEHARPMSKADLHLV